MIQANLAFLTTSERGDAAENRDLVLWCCGLPASPFNVAFPKAPLRDLDACLGRAREFFAPRSMPWRLTLRRQVAAGLGGELREAGFEEVDTAPAMLLDRPPPTPRAPVALEVREVEDDVDLERFAATAFEGFGLPAALSASFITRRFLELPHVALYLGLVDGEPVATSALVMTADVAGIYWVATREPFRKRGLGEALTWAAVEAGRRRGAAAASLQASKLGRPVYERMGFESVDEYVHFERPPAADASRG